MADQTTIYQEVVEAGADASATKVSQEIVELGASASTTKISQEVVELGAAGSPSKISQLCIELGVGPAAPPPPVDSPVGMFTFDEGLGNEWFIVLQLSDHGNELRDHVLKAVNITGKVTDARVKFYRYGPTEAIDMTALEAGSGFTTVVDLDDTSQVETSQRFPVNVPNARVSTIRIEGNWPGTGIRDRVDQAVIEAAIKGVRR